MTSLKIVHWNANGLGQHSQEVKQYLKTENIDIMLISESHFTEKSYMKIPGYNIYNANHPNGKGHGGAAVIVKSSIKHHQMEEYHAEHLQAATIVLEDITPTINLSAIYCPPKHTIKQRDFEEFFESLGRRFLAGGDYNAKHPQWGSRLTTPRGRELLKCMVNKKLHQISTGEPTYWPSDKKKIPDTIDFCVTKGIAPNQVTAQSTYDLSSDHSPVIVNLQLQHTPNRIQVDMKKIYNNQTDWDQYKHLLEKRLTCQIPLQTEEDINSAADYLQNELIKAAKESTPKTNQNIKSSETLPPHLKKLLTKKRTTRKEWQKNRCPRVKKELNSLIKRTREALNEWRNQGIQHYLKNLTPTVATDYSLWKATRKLKRPQITVPPINKTDGTWARSNKEKADTFASHLEKVFTPTDRTCTEEEEIQNLLIPGEPLNSENLSTKTTLREVRHIINSLHPKKSPGHDEIPGKLLKELPEKALRLMTIIFNAILRTGIFPQKWKIAKIVMIPKPGKSPNEVNSYRPISLLPIISKIFEKILLNKMKPLLEKAGAIPDHQFGFRQEHSTIEQVHRIVTVVNNCIKNKKYCSAAFLDISQAFDKVWHTGLLHKLKKILPHQYYNVLYGYLDERKFFVSFKNEESELKSVKSGVPQGSVLGPTLYLIYTNDIPKHKGTTVATYADDTAILAVDTDPTKASRKLQKSLDKISKWLSIWRVTPNSSKSVHITFTRRRATCPSVNMNSKEDIPQQKTVKYLGMHLDRQMTWKNHIKAKVKQIKLKWKQLYWMTGKKSQLTPENKLLLYKSIVRPIWTYGGQLWGAASNCHIESIQRQENKILRALTAAPWYVPNWLITQDAHLPTVREELKRLTKRYTERISKHPNRLARVLKKVRNNRRSRK